MNLFDDLKYVGTDEKLSLYGDRPWHCTSYVTEFSTDEMKFCVQQPHYHDGIFMGYTNMSIYVLTEDELVSNFKIINKDGSLKDILHSKDNPKLQKELKEIENYVRNISDEDLEKFFNNN